LFKSEPCLRNSPCSSCKNTGDIERAANCCL